MTEISIEEIMRRAVECHRAGRLAEAEGLYRQVLGADGAQPDALHMLGVLAYQARRSDLAIEWVQRALALRPEWPEALNTLAGALKEYGRLAEAAATFEKALALRPEAPEIWLNLGATWKEIGDLGKAEMCYRRALALRPHYADAQSNLGNTLGAQGRLAEAKECYRAAIRIQPDSASAHFNLAAALLMTGDFQNGWTEYEWRWKATGTPATARPFPQPQWRGEELEGKVLLVHAEQGFGDSIQFVRYLPQVLQRQPKRVILECQRELVELFKSVADVQVTGAGEALPPFDRHISLLSLPGVFKTELESIPQGVPYLRATEERARHFKYLMDHHPTVRSARFKIGFCWQGKPKPHGYRSMPVRHLSPLGQCENVAFISLQPDPLTASMSEAGVPLADFSGHLKTFHDSAALMTALDLVITIDTAAAHLAGALSKPTWTLLAHSADWRWLTGREDSPWYPTMRLFRQPRAGDWATVMENVIEALKALAAGGA